MASDKNHRPCLPLKPQEKKLNYINNKFNVKDINQSTAYKNLYRTWGEKSVFY